MLDTDAHRRARLAEVLSGDFTCLGGSSWPSVAHNIHNHTRIAFVVRMDDHSQARMKLAIRAIRRAYRNQAIIAIVPSGYALLMRTAFRAGATDCVEQSISDYDLRRCIAQAIFVAGLANKQEKLSDWMVFARDQLSTEYTETTRALVAAVEAKDPYTRTHSMAVADLAAGIGQRLSLPGATLSALRTAALLHDIGKIGIPDAILTKPGRLSEMEFDEVRRHPETGAAILGHAKQFADVRPMILHHHEHFDGNGYPAGLAGDNIPIGARVLAMADALDAMLSPRSYKSAYSIERVIQEIQAAKGKQFDPHVADVTLAWLQQAPQAFKSSSPARASSYTV